MAAATEEEIEEAAMIGDGRSARADCRGRGNGREGEKGSQWRDGVSRPEVAEDLDALADSEIANGKDVAEKQSGGRRPWRGLVDDDEDGKDGEDGRRSRRVGEEETERREEVEQQAGGAGERRPWREKRRELVGFNNPATAAERDGRNEENGDGAGAQQG